MTEIPLAQQHLEHAAHEGGRRAALIPLSTAVIGVAAGVLGILEGGASADAIDCSGVEPVSRMPARGS
jgi:hypothetical protein